MTKHINAGSTLGCRFRKSTCHTLAAVVQTQPHGGTIRQLCFIAKILKNVGETALEAAAHTAVDSVMM